MNFEKLTIKDVIMVTHSDLDGVGCLEALQSFLSPNGVVNKNDYQIPYKMDYNPMNNRTIELAEELIKTYPDKKYLFVTDRELTQESVDKLLDKYKDLYIIYIDHHLNTLKREFVSGERFLNFIDFKSHDSKDINKAAAELVVDFCEMFLLDARKISLSDWFDVKDLMRTVGDWDTFRWKSLPNGSRKRSVQILMSTDKIIGSKETYDLIRSMNNGKLAQDTPEVVSTLEKHYKMYKDNLDNLYNSAYNEIEENKIIVGNDKIEIGFLKNSDPKYFSILSSKLMENKVATIIIAVYDSGLVSARGDYFNNNINLQSLMSKLPGGGGGHFNAAGGILFSHKLDDEEVEQILKENPDHNDKCRDILIEHLINNII